jgi:hypothetical protein
MQTFALHFLYINGGSPQLDARDHVNNMGQPSLLHTKTEAEAQQPKLL